MSKACRLCGQTISDSLLKEKAKQKSDRIKEARSLAKKLGEPCGAEIRFNRQQIINLKNQKFTYREIARQMGCSVYTVFRVVKESRSNE